MPCVEERFDSETVPNRDHPASRTVPQDYGKFPAQMMQSLNAKIFIKMQSDLAVGFRAQSVAAALQFALNHFVAVELTVHDDSCALVLARDRLVASGEVNDAEPGMP